MGTLNKLFILLSILTTASKAQGKVNIRHGEYLWQHQITYKNIALELKYGSRSTYSGIFGRGWCSSIDYETQGATTLHCGTVISDIPKDLSERLRMKQELVKNGVPVSLPGPYYPQFFYKAGLLVKIQDPKGQSFVFEYDAYDNLVHVGGSKDIQIKYEVSMDRVIEVQEAGCQESINYKQTANHRLITYNKSCAGQHLWQQDYQLIYANASTGKKYIKEAIVQNSVGTTHIKYSERGEVLQLKLEKQARRSYASES